jgi:hypothetical protein
MLPTESRQHLEQQQRRNLRRGTQQNLTEPFPLIQALHRLIIAPRPPFVDRRGRCWQHSKLCYIAGGISPNNGEEDDDRQRGKNPSA